MISYCLNLKCKELQEARNGKTVLSKEKAFSACLRLLVKYARS